MFERDLLFIDGDWVAPAGSGTIEVISPHTEQVIGRAPDGTPADMDRAVTAARAAFDYGPWARMDPADRAAVLDRFVQLYGERMGELSELITAEVGTPISFSNVGQTGQAHAVWSYYASLGRSFAWEEERPGMMGPVTVRREPLGVVAAIVPWNMPHYIVALKLAPALIAGCSVVLKPAPETALDPYPLAEMFEEAGLPKGVINIVTAGREVGEYLVRHPGVDKVAFTGSTAAGRNIGAICGEQLKRCTLELGGKSAAIILDDADLGPTMQWLKLTGLMNNGEACVAQTRILASRKRYDEVVTALAETVGGMKVGDPMDPTTEIGPLVSRRQRERVESYIELGLAEGARIVVGGPERPFEQGWYVTPTVFADVTNDMRVAREEIFGPVLTVIAYDDEQDAIRIANDSDYGLAGSVWTADAEHGRDVARQVRAGTYGVNMFMLEPGAPFGGYKNSGIGRELGPEGLSAYLEYKSIARMG
ncbi:aldehyde dehydrogenase [Nocardia sp. NPDC004123]